MRIPLQNTRDPERQGKERGEGRGGRGREEREGRRRGDRGRGGGKCMHGGQVAIHNYQFAMYLCLEAGV